MGIKDGKHLSTDQIQRLRDYIQEKADEARKRGTSRPIVDELILLFLLDVGLKPLEICELNIQDFNPTIKPNSLYIKEHGGTKARCLDLPDAVAQKTARFIQLHRSEAPIDSPLIQSERGNRLAYVSLHSKLKRIGKAVGIGNITPNQLRHTYVMTLFEQEQDLRLVQKRAGHAHIKTTAQYIHGKIPCEACGQTTSLKEATRIDSGQMICQTCMIALRGH